MNRLACVIMACVCLVFAAGIVCAQEFSATIVTSGKDGSMDGTVWVSKDKIRMEMQPAVSIARLV